MADSTPLSLKLRPKSLDEIIGQKHLVAKGMIFKKMADTKKFQNVLLWGPPGSGKTSLAFALANDTGSLFHKLNATTAGIKDLRAVLTDAEKHPNSRTILVVDEIHRWAKNVQEVLLSAIEEGIIILIGLTVEAAQFAVTKSIVSRCLVLETKPLSNQDMIDLVKRVKNYYKQQNKPIIIDKDAASLLITRACGDARKIVLVMETIIEIMKDDVHITKNDMNAVMPHKHLFFDSSGSERYDYAHCYQEAIQNSDTDSALYWMGKWIASGEDPAYICRRMLITAFEDCAGNPNAWLAAMAATYTVEKTGLPECMIPMALATCEMGQSKRDKSAYLAIKAVMQDIENGEVIHVPPELRAGTSGYVKAIKKTYFSPRAQKQESGIE